MTPIRCLLLSVSLSALFGVLGLGVGAAVADSENTSEPASAPSATADQSSANFGKTGRFLPGEEVVTPTGKKMKVWSTEGPVSVSPPPEPFEDRVERRLPDNTHVVVDTEEIRRRRELEKRKREDQRGAAPQSHPGAGNSSVTGTPRDSFEVR